MHKHISILLVLTYFISCLAYGGENLITDAGRKVIVNDDGSWSFASDDRYATNGIGERVKLKADGTWEVLTVDEALSTQHDAVFRDSSSYQAIEFDISRAVIENHRTKTSVSSKNTHVRTQTLFYLAITVSDTELEAHTLNNFMQAISVADSSDKAYSLISASPASLLIQPGETAMLTAVIDDAPAWKLGKSYDLTIAADILTADEDIVLRIPLSEVKQINVDELTVL